jgi:hypothetical protein
MMKISEPIAHVRMIAVVSDIGFLVGIVASVLIDASVGADAGAVVSIVVCV